MRKFFFCIVGPSEWDGSAIHKGVEQIMMKKTLITALIATVFAGGAGFSAAIEADRKSTRLNSSHMSESRMPSSA